MHTASLCLLAWVLSSVPIGIMVGRFLRQFDSTSLPPVAVDSVAGSVSSPATVTDASGLTPLASLSRTMDAD